MVALSLAIVNPIQAMELDFDFLETTPEVVIEGVDDYLTDNIKAYLSLDDEPCDATHWRLKAVARRSDSEIKNALNALGYYDVKVKRKLSLSKKDGCWSAKFVVNKGEPITIRDISLVITGEALNDPDFKPIQRAPGFKKGEVFRSDVYEVLKDKLLNLAAGKGYLDAAFNENKVAVYLDRHVTDINLAFASGNRYRLGEVKIVQTDRVFDSDFVRRLVSLKEGGYFTNKDLFKIRSELAATNYFGSVDVNLEYENISGNTIPLRVKLSPAKKHNYKAGLGYSTDAGPRIILGHSNRRINNRGHRYSIGAKLSQVESELTGAYHWPHNEKPLDSWFTLDGGFQKKTTDTSESTSTKTGLSQTRRLSKERQQTLFVDAIYEDFTAGEEEEQVFLLMPGVIWSKSFADNPLFPQKGYLFSVELKGASDALLSDASMFQATLDTKIILGLTDSIRFLGRGKLGTTATDDFPRIPATLRFYAGGDNSIRGYDFETLGPTNDEGDVIGGKNIAVLSGEIEYKFMSNWGIATFIDAGNAFDTSEFTVRKSTGLGFRWFSPIGPVRIDVGYPLADPDQNIRLHFSLGPDL